MTCRHIIWKEGEGNGKEKGDNYESDILKWYSWLLTGGNLRLTENVRVVGIWDNDRDVNIWIMMDWHESIWPWDGNYELISYDDYEKPEMLDKRKMMDMMWIISWWLENYDSMMEFGWDWWIRIFDC